MYKIITIQSFWDDLEDIALNLDQYGRPNAAESLLSEIKRLSLGLEEFPRRYRKHIPDSRFVLQTQYRVMTVKGYHVFYVISEEEKTVELRRIIHRMMDIDHRLT
ncbi:MAG: type II toxin-antitoxin system RelE/ParE family toxin [Oscillospiraceae bacterium]|nr:type II toxin-antitoxin system RelE/ParE family toxin [Oscillospiraceae bacterium]